jgi:hypothetical protein
VGKFDIAAAASFRHTNASPALTIAMGAEMKIPPLTGFSLAAKLNATCAAQLARFLKRIRQPFMPQMAAGVADVA